MSDLNKFLRHRLTTLRRSYDESQINLIKKIDQLETIKTMLSDMQTIPLNEWPDFVEAVLRVARDEVQE